MLKGVRGNNNYPLVSSTLLLLGGGKRVVGWWKKKYKPLKSFAKYIVQPCIYIGGPST